MRGERREGIGFTKSNRQVSAYLVLPQHCGDNHLNSNSSPGDTMAKQKSTCPAQPSPAQCLGIFSSHQAAGVSGARNSHNDDNNGYPTYCASPPSPGPPSPSTTAAAMVGSSLGPGRDTPAYRIRSASHSVHWSGLYISASNERVPPSPVMSIGSGILLCEDVKCRESHLDGLVVGGGWIILGFRLTSHQPHSLTQWPGGLQPGRSPPEMYICTTPLHRALELQFTVPSKFETQIIYFSSSGT